MDHVLHYREPRQRLKALETIPKDMRTAYDDVLQRIERCRSGDKELAMKIFSWVLWARRPLLMEELIEALVVEECDRDLERDCMLQPSQVIECCKSLVVYEAETRTVRFTHYTVQEFLVVNVLKSLERPVTIAKSCLTYLAFNVFSHRCLGGNAVIGRTELYRFAPYAALFWNDHVRG